MSDLSPAQKHLEKKLEESDAIWECWTALLAKHNTWQIDVGRALQSKIEDQLTEQAQYGGIVPGLSKPADKEVALVRRHRQVRLTYNPAKANVPNVNSLIRVGVRIGDTTSSFE